MPTILAPAKNSSAPPSSGRGCGRLRCMDGLFSPSTIVALVVAVSFAAGLNVYATVLALGVLGRMHWAVLPPGLERLQDTWVMAASGLLFGVEVFADKVPGFDLVWNVLHTFIRIPVAALLAFAASSHLSPGAQALVTCLGIAVAAVAHGSKTAARVAVTPSPEPFSNIALSGGEDALAAGLSWAGLHHPLASAGVTGGLVLAGVGLMWWGYRSVKAGWQRWRTRGGLAAGGSPQSEGERG